MLDMEKLIDVFSNGNVAILPTDTVYGLHADALNIDAIKKVDDIKKSNKPHLILVSNVNMLKQCVKELSTLQMSLIQKYWPGKLTLLFEKSDIIPNELTKGSEYVGIRMPDNKMLLDIIEQYGRPLLSTSANITNEDVMTNVKNVDNRIKDKVDYIYDGGILDNTASTLIKIENNKIVFLREGGLSNKIKNDFKDYL